MLTTVAAYDNSSTIATAKLLETTTILVYGSEYAKGETITLQTMVLYSSRGANEPDFKTFSNKPIILKDYYEVSGSDTHLVLVGLKFLVKMGQVWLLMVPKS